LGCEGAVVTFAPRHLLPQGSAHPALDMPDQDLRAPFHDPAAPGLRSSRGTLAVRTLVMACPLCATLAVGALSLGWFAMDGRLTLPEMALIGLSSFAFFWMMLSVATATLGLFWRPRPPVLPAQGLDVAILLPMYGEAAEETVGNAVHLLARLSADRGLHNFSLHILSDTRAPAAAALEEAAVATARWRHPGLAITYRRRPRNTDYKSGNIRDWVVTSGQAHDAMLVLDADSLMGPQTVRQMADALAQEPGLGLIQTIPRVLPGRTIWQGLQSFASDVYGVNMGRGFALWTGEEGNFLGHNALLRVPAFATSAGLPHLPGKAPRGGVILSHDFVEAALLRRAGWGVRMMPEAEDSHEDTPETLIGYLKRDQRWCQGNLQHIRLLLVPGLHPLSRFHLLQGAMAYLGSLWWLALLLLWALPGTLGQQPDAPALLPNWPGLPLHIQTAIVCGVGLMLIAPKLLGLIGYLRRQPLTLARTPRFLAVLLAEVTLSALLAPALMVHQVRAVLRTLSGLDGGWMPHVAGRSDLRTLLRFHAAETVLGAALVILSVTGQLSLWLLPIAVSLCLSVPLAALVQMPRAAFRIPLTKWKDA
jgi:membrane glycosyltransferase